MTFSSALVLGGGGSVGNAWLIGVVAGLGEAGLDVTSADLIVGTSAGSTAAAQLTGAAPADLLHQVLTAAVPPRNPGRPGSSLLGSTQTAIDAATDASDMRRRIAATLGAVPADSARWRAAVAARLPRPTWPDRRVLITAVDADTGEPVVFDRDGDIDLVDAVAASCAGGFVYAAGGRRYIDGGYRAGENVDLACGHDRVLVLSPFGGRTRQKPEWGIHLAPQVEALQANGSRVETVFPDAACLTAFGGDMMNLVARASSARAGTAQGRALANTLAEFWS
jgi:NTE family protein